MTNTTLLHAINNMIRSSRVTDTEPAEPLDLILSKFLIGEGGFNIIIDGICYYIVKFKGKFYEINLRHDVVNGVLTDPQIFEVIPKTKEVIEYVRV